MAAMNETMNDTDGMMGGWENNGMFTRDDSMAEGEYMVDMSAIEMTFDVYDFVNNC